jgi:hypothetical protein
MLTNSGALSSGTIPRDHVSESVRSFVGAAQRVVLVPFHFILRTLLFSDTLSLVISDGLQNNAAILLYSTITTVVRR